MILRQRALVLVHYVDLGVVASIATTPASASIHKGVIDIQSLGLLVDAQLHKLKRRLRVYEERRLQVEHVQGKHVVLRILHKKVLVNGVYLHWEDLVPAIRHHLLLVRWLGQNVAIGCQYFVGGLIVVVVVDVDRVLPETHVIFERF